MISENELFKRILVHLIDEAIWNTGIRLTNSEWCRFVEIFDVIAWAEEWEI